MGTNPAPINQRNDPVGGNSDEDCVPASIAWIIEDMTGVKLDPGAIKDAVYGTSYTGPMAASKYVAYAAAHGVKLQPFDSSSNAALVAELHKAVGGSFDALVTIPSNWGTAPANVHTYSGSSHCVAIGYVLNGGLRAMNPWGGFWQDGTDAWWEARLLESEIWLASKIAVPAPAPKPTPAPAGAVAGWTALADGKYKCDATGETCGQGIYDYAVVSKGYRNLLQGERYDPGNRQNAYALFGSFAEEADHLVVWRYDVSPQRASEGLACHIAYHLDQEAAQLAAQVGQLSDQVKQLQAQLAQAPAQAPAQTAGQPTGAPTPDPAKPDLSSEIATLQGVATRLAAVSSKA